MCKSVYYYGAVINGFDPMVGTINLVRLTKCFLSC